MIVMISKPEYLNLQLTSARFVELFLMRLIYENSSKNAISQSVLYNLQDLSTDLCFRFSSERNIQ